MTILSIIIPTLNRPKLLSRALASIVRQDFNNNDVVEIVVVDDDFNNSSFEIVSSFILNNKEKFIINYLPKSINELSGVSSARNRALNYSTGEWVLFLDDDDLLAESSISKMLNAISDDAYDIVFGNYKVVEEDSGGNLKSEREIVLNSYSQERLLVQNYIPVGAFIIKKERIIYKFYERIESHEDWLFLLDNLVGSKYEFRVGFIDDVVVVITKSSDRSRVQRNTARNRLGIVHDYLLIYGLYPVESLVRARLFVLSQLGCPNIETLIGSRHSSFGFTMPTSQGRFFITNTAETIQKSLVERGEFEPLASKLAIAWCQEKSGAILDVGANQGVFSIPTASALPALNVIAVEPQPMVFMQLCTNVLINRLNNISVKNCAVGLAGNSHKLLVPKFDIYEENYTGSVSLDVETISIRKDISGIEEPSLRANRYECVSVFELSDIWPSDNVAFIKIDVEGMEQEVIESGVEKLEEERPAIFFESWGLHQFSEKNRRLIKIVEELGYIVVGFGDDKLAIHSASVINDSVKSLIKKYGQDIPGDLDLTPSWFLKFSLPSLLKNKLVESGKSVSLAVILIDDGLGSLGSSLRNFEFLFSAGVNLNVFVVFKGSLYESKINEKWEYVVDLESKGLMEAVREVMVSYGFDWFVFFKAGDVFFKDSLISFVNELASTPKFCNVVYGDLMVDLQFYGRPVFNIDGFLSNPYINMSYYFFRADVFSVLESFPAVSGDSLTIWLAIKVLEEFGVNSFGHVDLPLVSSSVNQWKTDDVEYKSILLEHLRKRGYDSSSVVSGSVPGTFSINYCSDLKPSVSIVVPTRDKLPLLRVCIESILEKTDYPNYEIIIVDNDSETPEARAWLTGLEDMALPNVRILRFRDSFNFSKINNYAVSEARGEYVLLLNNDTAVIRPDWLSELINHAVRPEVGVVGSKLIFPDGKVQHAGVVLGMRGPAEHVDIGSDLADQGYMNRLVTDQNYSAVTAACMMVRRSVYEQVDGLNEDVFKVSYNDIDFCLKVAKAGYLTVWTPRSLVVHVANASQTSVDKSSKDEKVVRFRREQEAMYEKWLPYLGSDPAFNRNLSLRSVGFEVEPRVELNWQPQKLLGLPTILVHPADQWGCGHYRIMQPLESMKAQAVAGGMIAKEWLTVPEMARLDPDAFVYQRQITPEAVENMKYARRFLKKPIVYELDDYLPNLPIKSAYRKNMPKDILKSLRASLKHVDRFVVSTHPLADAFKGAHPDIRVVENRLPLNWWADLSAARRQSEKPRVGWAGGVGHTGDLELVEAVVRDLADEVDWVFFGMCPEGLRPYVKEVHEGVNIELYPEKLASMNLDLAIAPLEDNLFNRCKSNLRLLEYGACGFPVVCSDVEPYRAHELPVTRVKNRYKDWVDAIRMHLSDLDETARNGDELREVVRRDWMLEGENLQQWLRAWTKF